MPGFHACLLGLHACLLASIFLIQVHSPVHQSSPTFFSLHGSVPKSFLNQLLHSKLGIRYDVGLAYCN